MITGICVQDKSFGEVREGKDGRLPQTLFQLSKGFCTLVGPPKLTSLHGQLMKWLGHGSEVLDEAKVVIAQT